VTDLSVSGASGRVGTLLPARTSSVAAVLTGSAVVSWFIGVSSLRPEAMGDSGLISVVGWPIVTAFALLAAAFTLSVAERHHRYLLVAQIVALVFMVQGLTALTEPHPAYFTAYLHVGFVDEILRNGHTVPSLDARFNWPGAFGLGALISAAGGLDSALYWLRWSPVAFNLSYLAPLWMIFRSLTDDVRVRWVALWIFVSANWVHQDYFSPQAVAYFLYLVVLAFALRWLSSGPQSIDPMGWGWLPTLVARPLDRLRSLDRADSDRTALTKPSPTRHAAVLWTLVAISAAVVASHQLTPFALMMALSALALTGRLRAAHLPVVIGVLFVGWFTVGATTWWSSHLGELLAGFGRLGDNAASGSLARLGGTGGRVVVLLLRVAFSVGLMGGALAVGVHRWRQGRAPTAALAMLVPPFALIGGQSYGGEILLRSYLFALPAACLLVADGVASLARSWGRSGGAAGVSRWIGASACVALLAVSGVAVRFGNEHFEMVTSADRAAVSWIYDNVAPGSVLIAPTRNIPWRYRDLTTYHYLPLDEEPVSTPQEVFALVPDDAPAYLISSRAQQDFGEQLAFLPAGWLDDLTRQLVATGRAELVFDQGTTSVYRVMPKVQP